MVNFYGPTGALPTADSTFEGGGIVNPTNIVPTAVPVVPNCWTTLEFARAFLNIDDDFALISALQAATTLVTDYLQIDYLQQVTTDFYKTSNRFNKILLARGPINSVNAVSVWTNDEQNQVAIIPPTGFFWNSKFLTVTQTGNGYVQTIYGNMAYNDMCDETTYQVEYDAGFVVSPTAGYQIMPQTLQLAVVYTAKSILMAITADPNVAGESAAGAYSMQYLTASVGNIPPSAQIMLNPYKRTAKW